MADEKILVLELRNPDFNTAVNVADAINAYTAQRYGMQGGARARLAHHLAASGRPIVSPTRFIAEIGELAVEPDAPARVVIDERTGTVVIGQDVQISTVAVTHGNLTVRVTESAKVSQPLPFSKGETVVMPDTVDLRRPAGRQLRHRQRHQPADAGGGLNRIGLKPTGIIAILQAIKSAGALQADLVVQ